MSRQRSTWARRLPLAAVITLLGFAAQWTPVQTQSLTRLSGSLLDQMQYRFIGPSGNRMIAIAGVPGDPNTYYAGAASGGVWKSVDGGIHWTPIFDGQDAQSIGSLAIAPSDSNIVWAGTGETFIRSNVSLGNGIYKSTDAGRTWKNMGLELTGRIGRILIDPRNPDVVFAAAMGHSYGPQPERGVFRTTDGGKTWAARVVPGGGEVMVSGVSPANPLDVTVVAVQADRAGHVFRSTDGGATWGPG